MLVIKVQEAQRDALLAMIDVAVRNTMSQKVYDLAYDVLEQTKAQTRAYVIRADDDVTFACEPTDSVDTRVVLWNVEDKRECELACLVLNAMSQRRYGLVLVNPAFIKDETVNWKNTVETAQCAIYDAVIYQDGLYEKARARQLLPA